MEDVSEPGTICLPSDTVTSCSGILVAACSLFIVPRELWMPQGVQGQVGRGPGQPDLVGDILAYGGWGELELGDL